MKDGPDPVHETVHAHELTSRPHSLSENTHMQPRSAHWLLPLASCCTLALPGVHVPIPVCLQNPTQPSWPHRNAPFPRNPSPDTGPSRTPSPFLVYPFLVPLLVCGLASSISPHFCSPPLHTQPCSRRDGSKHLLRCCHKLLCAVLTLGLHRRLIGKKPTCQGRRREFDPWVRKIPWRRRWQPTPVVLPGKSHGQRSLAGYSPWGHSVGHD